MASKKFLIRDCRGRMHNMATSIWIFRNKVLMAIDGVETWLTKPRQLMRLHKFRQDYPESPWVWNNERYDLMTDEEIDFWLGSMIVPPALKKTSNKKKKI